MKMKLKEYLEKNNLVGVSGANKNRKYDHNDKRLLSKKRIKIARYKGCTFDE